MNTYFLMLAMMGGEPTAAGLCDFMRREGESAEREQVRKAVQYLCRQERPLVEKAAQLRTQGAPYSYRLTERGRAVLAED